VTRLPIQSTRFQRTRFQRFSERLAAVVLGNWQGNWRHRSAVLLALLAGFYLGSNLTAFLLIYFPGGRPSLVFVLVVLLELVVRLRGRLVSQSPGLAWVITDNLRLGLVYAVVLEAFKLGS
jgi:hypothetical protein